MVTDIITYEQVHPVAEFGKKGKVLKDIINLVNINIFLPSFTSFLLPFFLSTQIYTIYYFFD